MQPPVWRTLISFSRSKFVQSSLVWVALVPVVARFTQGMGKTFHVRIGENVHVLTLAPPFTWSMFFFGALFFMLGNFIVNWKAPRILKETGNFREFADQGRSPFELLDLARPLTASGKLTDALLAQTRNFLEGVNTRIPSSGVNADGIEPAVAQAYEIVANEGWNYFHSGARWLAALSYGAGFFFYGYVLCQSIGFVFQHLTRHFGFHL